MIAKRFCKIIGHIVEDLERIDGSLDDLFIYVPGMTV